MKTREEKVEHLKKLTKISSAVLASNNHYALDKTVLERVQQKHDQAEEEKRVAEEKGMRNNGQPVRSSTKQQRNILVEGPSMLMT